jgi:hypothetical protein
LEQTFAAKAMTITHVDAAQFKAGCRRIAAGAARAGVQIFATLYNRRLESKPARG